MKHRLIILILTITASINILLAQSGAQYLIIAPDNFVSELQTFANWKTKKGIKTIIAPLSVTGSSASQIRSYILNAYNNWTIRPEYILLAGHGNVLPYSGYSDDYYANMDDNYRIELSVGRFPATTIDQIKNIVNKTLNYERTPFMGDTLWFRKGMTIVREDGSGYPPTSYPDTYYWENARSCFTFWLRSGYIHIDSLSKNRGHNNSHIESGITDGRAYVVFRGQSTSNWWSPFATEPNNCNNGYKLPVVISGTCATMSISSTGYAGDRFMNAGNITTPKGAVGFFGSTQTSSGTGLAQQRGTVSVGFHSALFEDKVHYMGNAAKRGKFILDSIQPPGFSQTRYNEWQLFGDPTLQLWTETPKRLVITCDSIILSSQNYFNISVRSVNGMGINNATVCLQMDTTIYTIANTNSQGQAILSIPSLSSGTMNVTVTANNFIPYEGTARFIASNQPYINYISSTIRDSLGNNDGKINPNEQIYLAVNLRNDGTVNANNIQATLRTNDPNIAIFDSTCQFGDINIGQNTISQGYYRFAVNTNCRNNYQLNFQLHIHDNQSYIWDRQFNLTVYAGKINYLNSNVIDSTPAGNNNARLGPLESGKIIINATNIGENLNRVNGLLRAQSPYLTITDSLCSFGNIITNASATNRQDPFSVSASPALPKNHQINFTLMLNAQGSTYNYYDTLYFSIISESGSSQDPTGPDAYGYWCYDNTDTASGRAPAYNWFEIGPGGPGLLIDSITNRDAAVVTLPLPFTFKYYGQNYDSISVCVNGFLALGRTNYRLANNSQIPDTAGPPAMIAPLWCDLNTNENTNPPGNGDVYQYFDAANHRWIVEFYDVAHYQQTNTRETFQIILLDPLYYPTQTGDGEILLHYQTVANPSISTIGIENRTETIGIQYMYNNNYNATAATLSSGRAIKFTTLPPINTQSPWLNIINGVYCDTINGNHNGIPEPGEQIQFSVSLRNNGNVNAQNVIATLRSIDNNVIITESLKSFNNIPISGTVNNQSDPFVFQVISNPSDSVLDFAIRLTANNYTSIQYISIAMTPYSAIKDNLNNTTHNVLTLKQNSPNPFNNHTQINYTISTGSEVKVKIYNINGAHIKTLVSKYQSPGNYTIVWNKYDLHNRIVPNGIYFYSLEAGNKKITRKMIVY